MPAQEPQPMPGHPVRQVSVIVPTWKRGDLLRKCLESLRRQTYTDFETCIVSNGAGPWAEDLAGEFHCKLIRFPENRGFAAAVNAGIKASNSQYIVILNDDAELDSTWLEKAVKELEDKADISFVGGKIYELDGRTIDDAGAALTMGGGAWRLGHGRADSPEFDGARPLLAVSMTAALFRRSVFDRVGLLDEHFISYLEDMDFSIRLWRAGLRGMYLPQAVARHHGGASLGGASLEAAGSRERFRLMTRNQALLRYKNYPAPWGIRLRLRIYWARLLWLGMSIRQGMLGAYVSGVWQYIRPRPTGFLRECVRARATFTSQERRAFIDWLQESERAVYEDIAARPRAEQDAYWRWYFAVFRPRRDGRKSTAVGMMSEDREKAGPTSLHSSN